MSALEARFGRPKLAALDLSSLTSDGQMSSTRGTMSQSAV